MACGLELGCGSKNGHHISNYAQSGVFKTVSTLLGSFVVIICLLGDGVVYEPSSMNAQVIASVD